MALRRVVERPDTEPPPPESARAESHVHPVASTNLHVAHVPHGARVALKERPPKTPPRPASDPEPSHRQPERSAQTVITSTPTSPGGDLAITPRPPTYEVGESPPEWWLQERVATRSIGTPPDLRKLVPQPAPDLRRLNTGESPAHLMDFRGILTAILVCLGVWALLDAPALARSAAQGPQGTRRSVAIDVLRPIARVSAALSLDRVSHVTDDVLGRHHPTAHLTAPPIVIHPSPPPPVTPPKPVALRVPTAAAPLRVLAVGDSLGLTFGQSVATKLDATALVHTTVDAREGTGLARPDAFDWPAQLRADIGRVHPEVIVVSFGGNDDQDVQVNGRFIPFNSPAWQAIYASRVMAVVNEARAAGADVLWSGLPVVRSAAKTTRLMAVMDLTRATLAGQPDAVFVDNRMTLADGAGHYTAALPDGAGNTVLVRQPDGIHETPAGADRLADKAIAAMRTAWHLTI